MQGSCFKITVTTFNNRYSDIAKSTICQLNVPISRHLITLIEPARTLHGHMLNNEGNGLGVFLSPFYGLINKG